MIPKHLLLLTLSLLLFIPAKSQKLVEVWRTGPVLKTPESVYYDEDRDVLYVSNINGDPTGKTGDGFISKLNLDGSVKEMKWVTGLDAPKGMAVFDGKLYVSDIQNLVVINIEKGFHLSKDRGCVVWDLSVTHRRDNTIFKSWSRG